MINFNEILTRAYNADSFSKNRDICSRDEYLHPLRSDTNEEIPGFPETIRDLERLEGRCGRIWLISLSFGDN